MRKLALQLYNAMLHDIETCKTKGFDEEKEIECCSQICSNYWNELRKSLAKHQFENDQEEIDFFKNLKPMFTSEIEFYNLMLHAQLFRPVFGKEVMEKFWWRESLRLERFTETNHEFYSYHKDGKTNFDRFFYLRRYNEEAEFGHPELTKLENSSSTRNDRLLAEYVALEKYTQYVQTQLDKLNTVTNGN